MTFDYTRSFAKSKPPVMLAKAQYGLAWQGLWLLSIRQRSVLITRAMEGNYMDAKPSPKDDDLLVAHDYCCGIDAPSLFQFTDGHFVNVSRKYPAYYRDLIAEQHLSADGVDISPTLYPRLARLVSLSGDEPDAKRLIALSKNAR